jgi:Protein of unknown function (DUF2853)
MSKFDVALDQYFAQLQTIMPDHDINGDFLRDITKQLGPTIYHRDASTVATADPQELEYVKTRYLQGKLGLADGAELDDAISSVSEFMKGQRYKYRAVFYYLLNQQLGLAPRSYEDTSVSEASVFLGEIAETPWGDKNVGVFIGLDRLAGVFTRHVDYDNTLKADGKRIKDIKDSGRFTTEYTEWGELVVLESKKFGTMYFQVQAQTLRQLNDDMTDYTGFEATELTDGVSSYYTGRLIGDIEGKVDLYANFTTQTYYKYTDYDNEIVIDGKPVEDKWESGVFEHILHDVWGGTLKFKSLEGETSVFIISDNGYLQEVRADLTSLELIPTVIVDYCAS